MKKIKKSIVVVAALLLMSMTNSAKSEHIEVETINDPNACWNAADAAEIFTCGYVGCNFLLWDAVYSACMGWDENQ